MQDPDGLCTSLAESAWKTWAAPEGEVHRLNGDFRGLEMLGRHRPSVGKKLEKYCAGLLAL